MNILYTHEDERVTDRIVMNANEIRINNVKINLKSVPFKQSGSSLVIHSPFQILNDEEVSITIEFEGFLTRLGQNMTNEIDMCNFIPKVLAYDDYLGWVKTSGADIDSFRLVEPGQL